MADSYFVSILGLDPSGPTLALALIETDGLVLRVAGRPDLRLPFAALSVALDPDDPERVLLRGEGLGAGAVVVEDRRVAEQIAAAAPAALVARWRALQDGGRREKSARAAFRVAGLAAGALAVAAGLWFGYGALVNYAVSKIPPSYEAKLSEMTGDADAAALRDPEVDAAVEKISARLIAAMPASPYRFRVGVTADEAVNAYALPGGRVTVLTGLIAQAETPDELAGVLAHEMQHVVHRHGVHGLVRSVGMYALFALAFSGGSDAAQVLVRYAPRLIGLRFNRGQEAEADADGMRLLLAAGIPGDGMVSFFKRQAKSESDGERALNFASDHPTNRDRVEELERVRRSLPAPPPVDWGLDWEKIRARCRAARATPSKK